MMESDTEGSRVKNFKLTNSSVEHAPACSHSTNVTTSLLTGIFTQGRLILPTPDGTGVMICASIIPFIKDWAQPVTSEGRP